MSGSGTRKAEKDLPASLQKVTEKLDDKDITRFPPPPTQPLKTEADPTERDLSTKALSSADSDSQEIRADVLQEVVHLGEQVKKLMTRFIDLERSEDPHPGSLATMKDSVSDIREELSSAHRRFGHIEQRIDSFLVHLNSRSTTAGISARTAEDVSSEVSQQSGMEQVAQQKAPIPAKSEPRNSKIVVSQVPAASNSAFCLSGDANADKTQAAQPQVSSSSSSVPFFRTNLLSAISSSIPTVVPTLFQGVEGVKVSSGGNDWVTLFEGEANLSERDRNDHWKGQGLGIIGIQKMKGGKTTFRVVFQRTKDGKEETFAQRIRHSMTSKVFASREKFSVLWSDPETAKYAAAFATSEVAVQFNQVFNDALKQTEADSSAGLKTSLSSSLSALIKVQKPIGIPCFGVNPPSAESSSQLAGQPSSSSGTTGCGGLPCNAPSSASNNIDVTTVLEGTGTKFFESAAAGGGDKKRANPAPVDSILQDVGLLSNNPKPVTRPARHQASQSVMPARPEVKSAKSASVYNLRSVPQPVLESIARKPEKKKQWLCDREGCPRETNPYVIEKAYLNHMAKHLVEDEKREAKAAQQ